MTDPILEFLLRPRNFSDLWSPPSIDPDPWAYPKDGKTAIERVKEGVAELEKIGPAPHTRIYSYKWGFFKQGRWLEGTGTVILTPGWGRQSIRLIPYDKEVFEHLLEEEGIVTDSETQEGTDAADL